LQTKCKSATELEIPVAWINRKSEGALAGDVAPTVEPQNLMPPADWLEQ